MSAFDLSPSISAEQPRRARLYCGRTEVEAELHAIGCGLVAIHTSRCPAHDGTNEDAAAIIPCDLQRGVLAVSDGVGGMPGGERAAALAVRSLARQVRMSKASGGELRSAILDAIETASKRISALGIGAATTLVAAEIDGTHLRPYHVGDSQLAIIGSKGKLKLLTLAHSPIGYAVESGLLDAEEAMYHADRNLVSNLVGFADMRIELGPAIPLSPRDTVILASDGLFDNLTVDDIIDASTKGTPLAVLRRLISASHERMDTQNGKPDDLTVLVYRQRVSTD